MICCVVIFPMPRDHRVSGALLALADLLTSEAGAGCGEAESGGSTGSVNCSLYHW